MPAMVRHGEAQGGKATALQSGCVAMTASLTSGLFNLVPADNQVPASERKLTSSFNRFNYTS